jgi:putative outer membrane lipoprotein carrier protein lolA
MQKKFKRIIYVSTIFLFIISSLTSQTIDNLVTVKGSYKQKNYIAKTKKTIESSGTFVLSRAHGIIWYTEKPQKSVTVMTEQKVLQVFPNGKEKILGNSGNAIFSSVALLTKSLFTQDTAVIEKYLHATQTESDVWVYTPKDDTLASVVKKIELKNADNGYIGSAVITYGNGDTTEYMLSVSSFNEALTTDATAYFEK